MSFFNGVTPQAVEEAPDGFKEFQVGDNDAYIKMVKETVSKESGNPMLEITFATEDGAEIRHYIVDGEWKLSKLKQLYHAFGIPEKDYINLSKWLYKEGVVVCKAGQPYNGVIRNKVSYLKPKNVGNRQGAAQRPAPAQQSTTARPPMEPGYMTPKQEQGQSSSDDFDDDIPF